MASSDRAMVVLRNSKERAQHSIVDSHSAGSVDQRWKLLLDVAAENQRAPQQVGIGRAVDAEDIHVAAQATNEVRQFDASDFLG